MRYENIRTAGNGYILSDNLGNEMVAKTLVEAAQIAGEHINSTSMTCYSKEYSISDLRRVHFLAREGHKIEAIKLLRDCFSPRLGLREAKDIVECFFYPKKTD
jgi:ribosomal protein L7/L12